MKPLLFTLIALLGCVFSVSSQNQIHPMGRTIAFTCPPCGCAGDTMHFDGPGKCPDCGAPLYPIYSDMENANKTEYTTNKKVAILLYPFVEIIDFTGPWEVLSAAGFDVYTVAQTDSIIECIPSMKIIPDYTFENCPQPDILIVPGGNADPTDTTTVNWISKTSQNTEHTMSVCTGAYYLAAGGLLNNQKATTFYYALPELRRLAPEAEVVDNMRFVDNGKIITSAGLTSGMDAAFHLISVYAGVPEAKEVAVLLEYDWDEKGGFVRAQLAERFTQGFISLFTPFPNKLVQYEGDENMWTSSLRINTELNEKEILKLIETQAEQIENWTTLSKGTSYSFINNQVKWNAAIQIKNESKNAFIVTVSVKKV